VFVGLLVLEEAEVGLLFWEPPHPKGRAEIKNRAARPEHIRMKDRIIAKTPWR
jgi:hypothetical protein